MLVHHEVDTPLAIYSTLRLLVLGALFDALAAGDLR